MNETVSFDGYFWVLPNIDDIYQVKYMMFFFDVVPFHQIKALKEISVLVKVPKKPASSMHSLAGVKGKFWRPLLFERQRILGSSTQRLQTNPAFTIVLIQRLGWKTHLDTNWSTYVIIYFLTNFHLMFNPLILETLLHLDTVFAHASSLIQLQKLHLWCSVCWHVQNWSAWWDQISWWYVAQCFPV